ncbi:hypothetical protein E0504_22750 [Parafrankia sp. BMG5.11]|nr:hypothetical protein E0504_22750 [Parafrankia sp. BMG5.11]
MGHAPRTATACSPASAAAAGAGRSPARCPRATATWARPMPCRSFPNVAAARVPWVIASRPWSGMWEYVIAV